MDYGLVPEPTLWQQFLEELERQYDWGPEVPKPSATASFDS
jgi:hypothetical protein